MIPTKFKQAYLKDLGAGDNPNTGSLPRCVCYDKNTPGIVVVLSAWEPSDEELEAIIRDRKVYVGVMASIRHPTQPPIYTIGVNPIDQGQFVVIPYEDLKHLATTDPPVL